MSHETSDINYPISEGSSPSDEELDDDRGDDSSKRPRLRLAHACDRCRKRKIRCDTQQPCGPCQATRNECTFNTPSRRVTKPKGSTDRSASTSGIKRPHSPPGSARIAALGGEGQANLEARLAALEAMLGDVPPKVHNAFLSSLDARLGSGSGVGLSGGTGEGVGIALEALAGGGDMSSLSSMISGFADGTWGKNGTGDSTPTAASGSAGFGSNATLAPSWNTGPGKLSAAKRAALADGGLNEMAKKMERMSFFYEDEIGQAKWQGECRSLPESSANMQALLQDSPYSTCSRRTMRQQSLKWSPRQRFRILSLLPPRSPWRRRAIAGRRAVHVLTATTIVTAPPRTALLLLSPARPTLLLLPPKNLDSSRTARLGHTKRSTPRRPGKSSPA